MNSQKTSSKSLLNKIAQAAADPNASDPVKILYVKSFNPGIAIALLQLAKAAGVATIEMVEILVQMPLAGKPQYDA